MGDKGSAKIELDLATWGLAVPTTQQFLADELFPVLLPLLWFVSSRSDPQKAVLSVDVRRALPKTCGSALLERLMNDDLTSLSPEPTFFEGSTFC